MRTSLTLVLSALTAAALAACSTGPTPFQSAAGGGYGYNEQQIEQNRYLVSFSGNSLTDRQTVETYLLYRAAELTRERGFDHFIVVRRDTDADTRYVGHGPGYSAFSVRYRYFHPRHGWYGFYDPFYNDVNIRESTRYEASAEIVMGRGAKPARADAFDAADVIRNLEPRVRRPDMG
jgi:hypothetical protein